MKLKKKNGPFLERKKLDFIEDGYKKMKSLETVERTPEVLAAMYQAYRKKMQHHLQIKVEKISLNL